MRGDKLYRMGPALGDACGSDYVCGDCGAKDRRLWREYQTFLDHQVLRCVDCARKNQPNRSASSDGDTSIGWLVPARPTPCGTTFWGHGAGDWAWWISLQQESDEAAERSLIRRERSRFAKASEDDARYAGEVAGESVRMRGELEEARKVRVPGNADKYRKALRAIERMDFSSLGEKPHLDDSDASNTILKMRLIADEALRS